MRIDVMELVPPEQHEAAWALYEAAFDELRSVAVQRHVMDRADFDDVMRDRRVVKFVGEDPEHQRLCALATHTNVLDAMPLISPDYFRRRWPVHFARGRIFYVGFVAVHPDYRGAGVFELLVTEMYRTVATDDGVAVLDVSRRNEQDFQLPQAVLRVLQRVSPTVRTERIDHQSYWAYEWPQAGVGRPPGGP
jgi:ribosomal protein S18 acetylase RimI-like enzyme